MLQMEKEIFYSENNIFVRRANHGDIPVLSKKMSDANVEELWVAHNLTPLGALQIALNTSVMALTIEHNGEPVGIFGIRTNDILGQKAEIYFLVTNGFEDIGRVFLRHARRFVDMFLEFYPHLEGMVYTKNLKSIFWMKYCGCKMDEAKPYGVEQKLFSHFYFTHDSQRS